MYIFIYICVCQNIFIKEPVLRFAHFERIHFTRLSFQQTLTLNEFTYINFLYISQKSTQIYIIHRIPDPCGWFCMRIHFDWLQIKLTDESVPANTRNLDVILSTTDTNTFGPDGMLKCRTTHVEPCSNRNRFSTKQKGKFSMSINVCIPVERMERRKYGANFSIL